MDSYQMASAAQLEDLFFDAFGMFLRENYPMEALGRRTGKELWDYDFNGLRLSHKETLSRGVAVWWTAGDKQHGRYSPKPDKTHYTSPHPIVLIYAGRQQTPYTMVQAMSGEEIDGGPLLGTLGTLAVAKAALRNCRLILATRSESHQLLIDEVWEPGSWEGLGFHDMWPRMGGPELGVRDLWVERGAKSKSYAPGASDLIRLPEDHLASGLYVLKTDDLKNVPLVANNRAHSFESAHSDAAMRSARREGRYLPFPMWFSYFAETPPPNLYAQQRAQYERLLAARQRP
jgi:hypothetical protein